MSVRVSIHNSKKEKRNNQADIRKQARAKTTITVKHARLAETVMEQTAEEICDAFEAMDSDVDERTKLDNGTDLVCIFCYNSTSRPQDRVATPRTDQIFAQDKARCCGAGGPFC